MVRLQSALFLLIFCLGILSPVTALANEVRLHFFYAENCSGCRQEKPFIEGLQSRYPQLQVRIYDVWMQQDNYQLMEKVAESQGVEFASTPTTAIGSQVWFGFNERIAEEIEAAIRGCLSSACLDPVSALAAGAAPPPGTPAPIAGEQLSDLPIDPDQYSLPAFTIVIGLLDSFNPCAFFVLLFLLSLMVHSNSRKRMFLVGGVFILFSGLIYFLFMAAWLNLFLLAGQLPLLTGIAGSLALLIALLNIKDHFFLRQGPSLALSEEAKPKLFSRMRNLLKGERMLPLLVGTSILAVVANSYELLCTAGFPMVYTRVLTLRELPQWLYYSYLGVYNLAYVLPLLVIVLVFSLTLGRHKLSEIEGRALKLLSGMMMLGLGLVLLIAPQLLQSLPAVAGLLFGAIIATGAILLLERFSRRKKFYTPSKSRG